MTAKEKAKELVDKFNYEGKHYLMLDAKQCALRAVDDIIKETKLHDKTIYQHGRTFYWQEVKQEIGSIKKQITPIARISATNIMENVNKVKDEVVNPLRDPLNHSLEVLLNEIKRGRPAETQQLIQSWIEQLNK